MKNIIDAIQPLLALNLLPKSPTEDCLITRDDQLYLYEVIGVLIVSAESENQVTFYCVHCFSYLIHIIYSCYMSYFVIFVLEKDRIND